GAGVTKGDKNGTTNREGVDGSPDSWITGYTTNYTMSIWTGFDSPNIGLIGNEKKVPHAILKNTMQKLSEGVDTPDFKQPDSVVKAEVEKGTNPAKKPSKYTPASSIVTELFVKGHEPGTVSDKYDKLDPVSDLSAEYDDDSEEIRVEWDYDSDDDVTFEISAGEDGGQMKEIGRAS